MGRFIITEEERKRIRGLYEMVGDKLSPQSLQSPKAQTIKKQSLFLNQYYTMNLSSATTGSWTDKDFNDTLKKFMEEKGVPVYICKKGDGYCADGDEGEVTTNEMGKLNQAMGFTQEDGQTPKPTDEKINTTNDKGYDYKLSGGKYYYSSKGKNNWTESTGKGLESIKQNVKFT